MSYCPLPFENHKLIETLSFDLEPEGVMEDTTKIADETAIKIGGLDAGISSNVNVEAAGAAEAGFDSLS
jgi:hypothetical protein